MSCLNYNRHMILEEEARCLSRVRELDLWHPYFRDEISERFIERVSGSKESPLVPFFPDFLKDLDENDLHKSPGKYYLAEMEPDGFLSAKGELCGGLGHLFSLIQRSKIPLTSKTVLCRGYRTKVLEKLAYHESGIWLIPPSEEELLRDHVMEEVPKTVGSTLKKPEVSDVFFCIRSHYSGVGCSHKFIQDHAGHPFDARECWVCKDGLGLI